MSLFTEELGEGESTGQLFSQSNILLPPCGCVASWLVSFKYETSRFWWKMTSVYIDLTTDHKDLD
jgi:hypothetical protein